MAIAMQLGGYTGGQADALRRTMGNIRKKGRLEAALAALKKAMLDAGRDGRDRAAERRDGGQDLRRPRELRELWIS